MSYLLDSSARETLNALAQSRAALVFDFDGTLAPIVANRDQARMRRRTRTFLNVLCSLYPCAVVSGRSQKDAVKLLEDVPMSMVFGSHGLEPCEAQSNYQQQMAELRQVLVDRLSDCPGIDIEDKIYSLAVHYRQSEHRSTARQRIIDATQGVGATAIRLVHGKCVVNIVPKDARHKGDAVRLIQRNFEAERVLFLGDDDTDEDVFRQIEPHWLGVRVGKSDRSAAKYFLRNQRETDSLLWQLIVLRRDQAAPPV